MLVVTIFPEFSGVVTFANDTLKRQLPEHEIAGNFHAIYLTEDTQGEREQFETEMAKREPNVFLIWHSDASLQEWAKPLESFLRERFPKTILIWVVWEIWNDKSFEFMDRPESGSFMIDYGDPKKCLRRWAEDQ